MVGGVRKALQAFGAKKIVVGTPYADELNCSIAGYLAAEGFELLDFQGLNLDFDRHDGLLRRSARGDD